MLPFETIEYLHINQEQRLLLFADFEKVFDSLNHSFIFRVLLHMNFGDSFIKWVKPFIMISNN